VSDPTTSNILLAVPTRGSDSGTWDLPVNSNSTALDGYIGGVQTISLTTGTVTLTAPAGTVTAVSGPTQAQNGVIRLTGTISGSVQVRLPIPGYYIIDNQCVGVPTSIVQFAAIGGGRVVCVDYGEIQHIYNDGTHVSLCNLGRVGAIEIWAGLTTMPSWVTSCTIPPYLLCDGNVYNGSTYPALIKKLQAQFGGNGSTTFGVPDLRGRIALPYDGTGGRITSALSGINGTVLGSAADNQSVTLAASQIPGITGLNSNAPSYTGTQSNGFTPVANSSAFTDGAGGVNVMGINPNNQVASQVQVTTNIPANTIVFSSNNTGGQPHTNVQPSIMTGIAVIRAA
jgi:microcystin-dependent protein